MSDLLESASRLENGNRMNGMRRHGIGLDVGRTALAVTAVWMTIVVIGNVIDVCVALGVLPKATPFASGNDALIHALLAKLAIGNVAPFALVVAIVLEGAIAAFLWIATWRRAAAWEDSAFAIAVLLFGGFVIIDELCASYQAEAVHRGLVMYVAILYLVVRFTRD